MIWGIFLFFGVVVVFNQGLGNDKRSWCAIFGMRVLQKGRVWVFSVIEAISIGDKHYWYSDGKWTEASLPQSQQEDRGADFAKKLADMIKDVKYVGPETVNGIACYVYNGTFETSMAGQKWIGKAKVWIGGADGLPDQSDSEFKIATYGGKSHTVYEYGVRVKVEAPI